jgi:hypothetical protein
MNQKIAELVESLESLKIIVEAAGFTENSFDQQHGWNQVHLHKHDITNLVHNFIAKLNSYNNDQITDGLDSTIGSHINNINRLSATSKSYFTNNPAHLLHIIPVTLNTILTIYNDVEVELFSWENINDKKMLPRSIAGRLRSTKAQLDSFDESCENLKGKIKTINDAHETAESLPTDLASLKEAKKNLETFLSEAKQDLIKSKDEIANLKTEILFFHSDAEKATTETLNLKGQTNQAHKEALGLVAQCDDALQITTTQGLAAGFDQKAKELRRSIWIWIVGLLIALGVGAWIGAERVAAFTQALEKELTTGQALLHTIMSIFSIGGPLWLAWISTQQITQRFKLSEDYSYKATVSKAFTGFSKFAERFDSETEKRLFNSTLDRLDEMPLRLVSNKDYNSPWHEFIDSDAFRKALDIVPSLAQEAGRFASHTNLKLKSTKHSSPTKAKTNAPVQEDDEKTPIEE